MQACYVNATRISSLLTVNDAIKRFIPSLLNMNQLVAYLLTELTIHGLFANASGQVRLLKDNSIVVD